MSRPALRAQPLEFRADNSSHRTTRPARRGRLTERAGGGPLGAAEPPAAAAGAPDPRQDAGFECVQHGLSDVRRAAHRHAVSERVGGERYGAALGGGHVVVIGWHGAWREFTDDGGGGAPRPEVLRRE